MIADRLRAHVRYACTPSSTPHSYRENTDLQDATPFIDRIAADGVKLEAHYVQPACTPTRGCLLTGRYAFRLGFQRGVLSGLAVPDSLPLDERTMAQELQAAGYRTGLFGKWRE